MELAENDVIAGSKAPLITIDFEDSADHVFLLRCAKSYKLQTLLGTPIDEVDQSKATLNELKGAWTLAVANSQACKVVASYITTTTFPDIAAPSGTFYYVLNPCISKEKNVYYKTECSGRLSVSKAITYTSAFRDEVRDLYQEIDQAQAGLMAQMTRAAALADLFRIRLTACENKLAFDIAGLNIKNGLVMLGTFVALGAASKTASRRVEPACTRSKCLSPCRSTIAMLVASVPLPSAWWESHNSS